jgi:hypothetical protein
MVDLSKLFSTRKLAMKQPTRVCGIGDHSVFIFVRAFKPQRMLVPDL